MEIRCDVCNTSLEKPCMCLKYSVCLDNQDKFTKNIIVTSFNEI